MRANLSDVMFSLSPQMWALSAEHYISLAGIYRHKSMNAHIFACFVQIKQTGWEVDAA